MRCTVEFQNRGDASMNNEEVRLACLPLPIRTRDAARALREEQHLGRIQLARDCHFALGAESKALPDEACAWRHEVPLIARRLGGLGEMEDIAQRYCFMGPLPRLVNGPEVPPFDLQDPV